MYYFKNERGISPIMISLYLGWNGCSRGSIPLASYCLSKH
nr:MAG TPA: hypothetical protein [Caudoviricetes sp.]